MLIAFQAPSSDSFSLLAEEKKDLEIDLNLPVIADKIEIDDSKSYIPKQIKSEKVSEPVETVKTDVKPTKISISSKNEPEIFQDNLKSLQINQVSSSEVLKSSSSKKSQITIPRINLYKNYQFGSMTDMDSLDQKLNQSIVAESVLSKDACIEGGNAYLMGHSEPTSSLNKNKTGSYVFSRINELINGDTINLTNGDGVSCSYEVYETFNVVTDYDNNIDLKTFDNLINPQMVDKGMLTIQTCQKGSTTVRLIVRARLVSFS